MNSLQSNPVGSYTQTQTTEYNKNELMYELSILPPLYAEESPYSEERKFLKRKAPILAVWR